MPVTWGSIKTTDFNWSEVQGRANLFDHYNGLHQVLSGYSQPAIIDAAWDVVPALDQRLVILSSGWECRWTLILLACSEFRIFAAYNAPRSVNMSGGFLRPLQLGLDVSICDFKISNSSLDNWNMKSSRNLERLSLTCSFKWRVSTPYSSTRSESRITFVFRMIKILEIIRCSVRSFYFSDNYFLFCSIGECRVDLHYW